jgi:hypothetical protein
MVFEKNWQKSPKIVKITSAPRFTAVDIGRQAASVYPHSDGFIPKSDFFG